jgi:hypothetical protein
MPSLAVFRIGWCLFSGIVQTGKASIKKKKGVFCVVTFELWMRSSRVVDDSSRVVDEI